MPVFLLTVFGKGQKSNLSDNEKAQLKKLTKAIEDEYRDKVSSLSQRRKGRAK